MVQHYDLIASCEIYQIFTGTSGESGELADLKYGANYGTKGSPVPEDVASSIGTQAFYRSGKSGSVQNACSSSYS